MAHASEVEITQDLVLDETQTRLIDAHSLVNILTVLVHAVEIVGTITGDAGAADVIAAHLIEWSDLLTNRRGFLAQLGRAPEIRERVLSWAGDQRALAPEAQLPPLERYLENIKSVLDILGVRVAELLDRAHESQCYRTFSVDQLRASLVADFKAVEKNSLGRYRIAFSPGERTPGDYLVELDLTSRHGPWLRMPAVLADVVRDLACNARKYTDPGGWIAVTLREHDDGSLVLQVEDNGRGISEEEIPRVVLFGYRAGNAKHRVQMGGGFGLTKAYSAAKKFGGRMWICSGPGAGTRVTIRLPSPATDSGNS